MLRSCAWYCCADNRGSQVFCAAASAYTLLPFLPCSSNHKSLIIRTLCIVSAHDCANVRQLVNHSLVHRRHPFGVIITIFSACHCCTMRSVLFRLSDPPEAVNVMTRYSPANRTGRTCFFWLLPGRLDLPVPYVPLCLLCTVPVLQPLRLGWRRPILVGGPNCIFSIAVWILLY